MDCGLGLEPQKARVGTWLSKAVQSVRRVRRNHLEDSFNQNRDRPARLVGGKTFWRGQFKSIRSRPAAPSEAGRHFSRFETKVSEKSWLPPQLFTGLRCEFCWLSAAAHE